MSRSYTSVPVCLLLPAGLRLHVFSGSTVCLQDLVSSFKRHRLTITRWVEHTYMPQLTLSLLYLDVLVEVPGGLDGSAACVISLSDYWLLIQLLLSCVEVLVSPEGCVQCVMFVQVQGARVRPCQPHLLPAEPGRQPAIPAVRADVMPGEGRQWGCPSQ
jgi:hypothetical protein